MDYKLHDSLGYHLSRAARIQERRLEEDLKRLGLTRTTWCVLLAVGMEKLSQPSDIAAFIGIDRTATSRAFRQMESDGLIARDAGRPDRRTTSVSLTAKGEAQLAKGRPFAEANNKALSEKLGAEDAHTVKCLLAKLIEGEAALSHF